MPRPSPTAEQRRTILQLVRPGWKPMTVQNWVPKGTKPTTALLKEEILRRADLHKLPMRPRPANWSWQQCIDWLTQHEPEIQIPVIPSVPAAHSSLPLISETPLIPPTSNTDSESLPAANRSIDCAS